VASYIGDGGHHGAQLVVGEHEIGGLPGDLGSPPAHGNADVRMHRTARWLPCSLCLCSLPAFGQGRHHHARGQHSAGHQDDVDLSCLRVSNFSELILCLTRSAAAATSSFTICRN
jgi:hypothetical protein